MNKAIDIRDLRKIKAIVSRQLIINILERGKNIENEKIEVPLKDFINRNVTPELYE